eukprot:UN4661
MGFLIAVVAAYFPLWCLDLSLVAFHCFLCWKDITTYEYLTGKTKRPAPPPASLGSPKAPSGTSDRHQAAPPGIGPCSVSGLAISSLTSAVELPRTVSDFMFGNPAPADPAEVDPLQAREAMKDPPPPRHRAPPAGNAGGDAADAPTPGSRGLIGRDFVVDGLEKAGAATSDTRPRQSRQAEPREPAEGTEAAQLSAI